MSLDTYVRVIDTIKPQRGKNYPIVEAEDVLLPNGNRLSDGVLPKITESDEGKVVAVVDGEYTLYSASLISFVPVTQEEYNELVANGEVDPSLAYMIVRDVV